MGNPPQIAIIIPTLDEAQVLPALLEQLAGQQGVSLELIVADGGSSDATVAQAEEAGATVVETRRGRARQMNAAVRASTAPYLMFLHADCALEGPYQLSEALVALRDAAEVHGSRVAGHFALRFARKPRGAERLFRTLEQKSALNRPDTINGDQGLLIARDYLAELGGFDERLPFLEDARLARDIFRTGRWIVLPGRLTTSARRFEVEGPYRRYALMALMMGLHSAGADEYFARANEVYAAQSETGKLRLAPHLALLRSVLRDAGHRRAAQILWRAGRYTRNNCWQLFFWGDLALGRSRTPLLRFYDRVVDPAIDNAAFDVLGMLVGSGIYLGALPLACALFERPQRRGRQGV
ncbi:MAG TPA: TIGR04283 family arsenosugar biosynthesis glycosyltransferase [Verrucomicrobiae bacterium]|nr:TIGR04283 family arsenosugar biosynthesis glycosyltransferase [Verrucomicrobiae bacterium]